MLADLKGLKFRNKIGAAFGSYGWGGEGVKVIEDHLAECKIPLARPGIRVQWQPSAEDLEKCRVFGKEIGAATKAGE